MHTLPVIANEAQLNPAAVDPAILHQMSPKGIGG